MSKKKGHAEGHVNHERWLVSYADFITLLFAFFVVMYSISDLNSKKVRQVTNSVRFAMHFQGSGGTSEPGVFGGRSVEKIQVKNTPGTVEQWVREAATVYEFLAKDLGEEFAKDGKAVAKIDERGVVIGVPARWLFQPLTANVTNKADEYLSKLVEGARKYHKDILLSGITARAAYDDDGPYRDTVDLQLQRLAELERMLTKRFEWPVDRATVTSQVKKSSSGSYASAAQADRGARIELILLR
jgi:chemotaxis protein MotB